MSGLVRIAELSKRFNAFESASSYFVKYVRNQEKDKISMQTDSPLAPIALFVYNRPQHTQTVIESLRRNSLAQQSDIVIYSDAPKSDRHRDAVNEVRSYLATIDGFRSIAIVERSSNLGVAKSISSGVTELIERHGRVIVLEDDLVTSPLFLDYMNSALDFYRDVERVMHVAAYMYPLADRHSLPEAFFYRGASCWGWGTWERAWRKFSANAPQLSAEIRERDAVLEFNLGGALKLTDLLERQISGELDSWNICWHANVFLNNGLCLHPRESFTTNIGLDGTGRHCHVTRSYDAVLATEPVRNFPTVIEEDRHFVAMMKGFYAQQRSIGRIRYLLERIFKRGRSANSN